MYQPQDPNQSGTLYEVIHINPNQSGTLYEVIHINPKINECKY